jgi:hypothetical protein
MEIREIREKYGLLVKKKSVQLQILEFGLIRDEVNWSPKKE